MLKYRISIDKKLRCILVSIYLTDTNVPGRVIGTRRACHSLTHIDVIIVLRAVADDQEAPVSLCKFTQVKAKT